MRTILVTTAASLIAGLLAHVVDQLFGLESLTEHGGGAGSMLRLLVLGLIMLPIIGAVMLAARVPEAQAALAAAQRRLGKRPRVAGRRPCRPSDHAQGCPSRTLIRGIRSRRGVVTARRLPGAGLRRRLPEPGCGKDQR